MVNAAQSVPHDPRVCDALDKQELGAIKREDDACLHLYSLVLPLLLSLWPSIHQFLLLQPYYYIQQLLRDEDGLEDGGPLFEGPFGELDAVVFDGHDDDPRMCGDC